jgi:protoheme IX farnesyltransferase
MIVEAVAVLRERDEVREPAAKRLFAASITYLFVLFAALIAEHLLGVAPFGVATFGAWM